MNIEKVLNYALIGFGAYVIYKLIHIGKDTQDSVADAIAKGYMKIFGPEDVDVTGSIITPDGIAYPLSSGLYVDENMHVVINGRQYTVQSRDANGNYHAV